jgi:hypothetical protein
MCFAVPTSVLRYCFKEGSERHVHICTASLVYPHQYMLKVLLTDSQQEIQKAALIERFWKILRSLLAFSFSSLAS